MQSDIVLDDIPVIPAIRFRRQLTFWCQWCVTWHWHSVHGSCGDGCRCPMHSDLSAGPWCECPIGSGDGHRVAHCTPPLYRTRHDSPWKESGYILREVPAAEYAPSRVRVWRQAA